MTQHAKTMHLPIVSLTSLHRPRMYLRLVLPCARSCLVLRVEFPRSSSIMIRLLLALGHTSSGASSFWRVVELANCRSADYDAHGSEVAVPIVDVTEDSPG